MTFSTHTHKRKHTPHHMQIPLPYCSIDIYLHLITNSISIFFYFFSSEYVNKFNNLSSFLILWQFIISPSSLYILLVKQFIRSALKSEWLSLATFVNEEPTIDSGHFKVQASRSGSKSNLLDALKRHWTRKHRSVQNRSSQERNIRTSNLRRARFGFVYGERIEKW